MAMVRPRMVGQVRQELDPHNGQTGFQRTKLYAGVEVLPLYFASVHHQPEESIPSRGVGE